MANYVLYHTDGCHLCEQAEQVLLSVLGNKNELELIDIMTDEQLIARFQLSIPVFESKTGQHLYWPFDAQRVHDFLAQE
ncbi:glutaredoxin family protein [Pseudoalteromonas espejiana]